jgi:hypothetical protein
MALYRHDLAICPWCEGESGHRVDHLYDGHMPANAGPWYCKECRRSFRVKVNAPGDVELTKYEDNRPFTPSLALLKFDGKDGPVFFIMKHDRYRSSEDETDAEIQGHQRYFYEDHSCPTNWLRECVAVIEDGDADPHGFLDFVRAVDVSVNFDEDDDSQWPILFPEAFAGETIDGELAAPQLLGGGQ